MTDLQPAHPGNTNALRHGVYSPRVLEARAEEVADLLMALPHTVPIDRIAAVEIGRLVALIERIDGALASKGVSGQRTLLDAAYAPVEGWSGGSAALAPRPRGGPHGRPRWAAPVA